MQDDWLALHRLLREPAVLANTLELPYMGEDAAREHLSSTPPPGTYNLVAAAASPSGRGQVLGAAWLTTGRGPRRRHSARLTAITHPTYPEAITALVEAAIDLAENWLGLHRLELRAFAADTETITCCEALGFEQEAVLRQYAVRGGQQADVVVLARVPHPAPPPPAPPAPPSRAAGLDEQDIFVRGTEADDWEDLSEVYNAPEVIFGTLQTPYQSRDVIRNRFENIPSHIRSLVAEVDEQVVGNLGLYIETGRRAHAAGFGMMVHPDFQGQGVGRALLEAAIDLAENWLHLTRIELEVFPDNVAALGLYERCGFEVEGRRRDASWRDGHYVDNLVMSRIVKEQRGE